jgi:hypothetical protein
MHSSEKRVQELQGMDDKTRIATMNLLRKEGIKKRNMELLAKGAKESELLCERASSGTKVMCSQCSGTFKQKYFSKHQARCVGGKSVSITGENSEACSFDVLLGKMAQDEIFEIIKKDEAIQLVGKHILAGKKPNKLKETKIKVRSAMRRLARLVQAAEGVTTCRDLLKVGNFYILKDAILKVSDAEGLKPGLKVAVGTLIKTAIKVLTADAIINEESHTELSDLEKVLNLNYGQIFNEAEYCLKEKRQRETRKPAALPSEMEIEKLRQYLNKYVEQDFSNISTSNYIHLRKVVLARLTLLNSRRGSETARMLIKDFQERNSWIENAEDRKNFDLVYVMGKGHRLISILIPKNILKALEVLVDAETRARVGIKAENQFVFAYTRQSDVGTTGYNELRDVCNQLQIPVITATSMRHRGATLFWRMEGLSEQSIVTFTEHMGHSTEMSRDVYAVPPAVRTINTVGRILTTLDKVFVFRVE